MDKSRISKHIPFPSPSPSPLPGHVSPQGLLTLSIAYSRTSFDPPQHLHSHSLPPGRLSNSMMRLQSTTLLSLVSQPIDLPSPGTRIPTISHPMTKLPPDVLSPICSSLLPREAVRFPESTTTSLSLPSLTARRLPSHLPRLGWGVSSASSPTPTSDLGDICRDRYKSAKR
jgi:hypothetical protein